MIPQSRRLGLSLTPAALDDDVVEGVLLRKLDQLRQQVTTKGAADTAILESNDFLLGLGDAGGLNQGRIDVDTDKYGNKC